MGNLCGDGTPRTLGDATLPEVNSVKGNAVNCADGTPGTLCDETHREVNPGKGNAVGRNAPGSEPRQGERCERCGENAVERTCDENAVTRTL